MARLKKKYFECVKNVNIGVNEDGTYKKQYKKGDRILIPVKLIDYYKKLNIIK